MPAPARKVAFQLLRQIEIHGAYSDYALHSAPVATLDIPDRNLTTEIVYGTLRWQGRLDYILSGVLSRPLRQLDAEVRILLRLSLYQMAHMERIPYHAVVHDAVDLSKIYLRRGADKFVNGVLRRLSRERPWQREDLFANCPPWDRVSLPEWLWLRWAVRFGEEKARDFAFSLNQTPRATFRRPAGHRVLESSRAMPEGLCPSDLVPNAFHLAPGSEVNREELLDGKMIVQDEASQLIAHLLGPISGWSVWDACAAPGGKASILRELCGPDGSIVMSEIHLGRASRLRSKINRQQGAEFHVVVLDASVSPPFRRSFDAVLVDAPCSGLGTIRRNPEIKWRSLPERLGQLHDIQLRILSAAAKSVRVGGFLLYSTCSTEPEENEQVVDAFLQDNPSFRLRSPEYPRGIVEWIAPDGMVRTFPCDRLWDGFFASLMERRSS